MTLVKTHVGKIPTIYTPLSADDAQGTCQAKLGANFSLTSPLTT